MLDSTENARLMLAVSVGVGLIAAGVGNALVGPRRWVGQLMIGLLGVAAATGVAWLFESDWPGWIGGAGVGGLGLLTAARNERVRRLASAAATPFRTTRGGWAAVAAVGVGGLGYEVTRFDRVQEEALDAQMADIQVRVGRAEGVPVSGLLLVTDRGHKVTPLAAPEPRTPEQLRKSERLTLNDLPSRTQLIHRGPASDGSNCHGWVFTGGRYGLTGRDVETILADNGYAEVGDPHPGDACVYRDDAGGVAHSSLVRAVCDDGTILVEGKWGWMGVYLHPVQSSCYGQSFHYYRTARGSHLLAAFSETPPVAASHPTP